MSKVFKPNLTVNKKRKIVIKSIQAVDPKQKKLNKSKSYVHALVYYLLPSVEIVINKSNIWIVYEQH